MNPTVASGRLAALFDGRPKLIVLPGVEAPEALALLGLALWALSAGAVLHPWSEMPEGAGQPLPATPGGVLGIVAPDRATAAALLAWWDRAGPAAPPLIEAASGPAALPLVATRAIAALAESAAQGAAMQQGLVALREEHEALRLSQARLRQAASQLLPPAPPTLVATAVPSAGGHAVVAGAGGLALGQALGLKLEGLAAVALHLAEARAGAGTMLRVRLYGAESGRIAGAWLLPGTALAPGWLTLDLPEPVGPLRETAWLEVKAELTPGDRLSLSLSAKPVMPGAAVSVADAPAQARALAHALWTAVPGRWLVQALHWDAEVIGLPAPPSGAPVELPQQVWQAAEVPEGRVERVGLGQEPARLLAVLPPGGQALVVLPAVPLNGLDLLRAELDITLGDAAWLEAALWLQPEGAVITSLAGLDPAAPGARWSGWHPGQFGEGVSRLALALPPDPPRRAVVALALRNRAAGPAEVLQVEIARLSGTRAVAAPPETAARAQPPLRIPPAAPPEAPAIAAVRLLQRYASANGRYMHLDLLMEGVRAGGFAWPRLRCKLAQVGDTPQIEFRQRPDWPVTFETWPPSPSDGAGPYLQLREEALTGDFPRTLSGERDRATLATVLRLLPVVVLTVARDATTDPGEYDRWIAAARRLAATIREEER